MSTPQNPGPQQPYGSYPQQPNGHPQGAPSPQQGPYPQPGGPGPQGYPQAPQQQYFAPTSADRVKSQGWASRIIGAVVVIAVIVAVRLISSGIDGPSSSSLRVGDCVTLSSPAGSTNKQDVEYTKGECTTKSGGPVSYVVADKLTGTAACPDDYMYVEETTSKKSSTKTTVCLVENLAVGQCVYLDDKEFMFDVACSDPKAVIKITKREETGSGVTCADDEDKYEFPKPGRTYCFGTP